MVKEFLNTLMETFMMVIISLIKEQVKELIVTVQQKKLTRDIGLAIKEMASGKSRVLVKLYLADNGKTTSFKVQRIQQATTTCFNRVMIMELRHNSCLQQKPCLQAVSMNQIR